MKSKTSASLLLILTFLLGGITGAVSYSIYQHNESSRGHRPNHDPVNDMAKILNLDAQQKEKLKQIMGQGRDRYRALSLQMRPQYDAIRNETRQQIRQILHEDQKQRFEDFLKDLDRQRRERDNRP